MWRYIIPLLLVVLPNLSFAGSDNKKETLDKIVEEMRLNEGVLPEWIFRQHSDEPLIEDNAFRVFLRRLYQLKLICDDRGRSKIQDPVEFYQKLKTTLERYRTGFLGFRSVQLALANGQVRATGGEALAKLSAGILIGAGLEIGVGYHQNRLRYYPHIRIGLLTASHFINERIGGLERGVALVTANLGLRSFSTSNPDAKSPSYPQHVNRENWALGAGVYRASKGNNDDDEKMREAGFSIGLGIDDLDVNRGVGIPLPIPLSFFSKSARLLRRLEGLEYRIVRALRSGELVRADSLYETYALQVNELQTRMTSAGQASIFPQTEFTPNHALASVENLFSPEVEGLYVGIIRRIGHACEDFLQRLW